MTSRISKKHPLTPRKQPFPAWVAAAILAGVSGLCTTVLLFQLTAAQGISPFDGDTVFLTLNAIHSVIIQINHELIWDGSIGGIAHVINVWCTRPFIALHAYGALLQVCIRWATVLTGAWLSGQIAYNAVRRRLPAIPDVEHVSGARPCLGAFGAHICRKAWRDRIVAEGAGVEIAPGVNMPLDVECEQLAVIGATGSGKSSIIDGIERSAKARGDRIFKVEVKGAKQSSAADTVELGLGIENLVCWAIGEDVRDRQDAAELAEILIPSSRDPIWSDGGRMYLTALVVSQQQTRGPHWGWNDLHLLLSKPFTEQEALVIEAMPDVQLLMQKKSGEQDVSNTMLSILITVVANVGAITWALAGAQQRATRSFSLRAWATGKLPIRNVIAHLEFYKEAQSTALLKLLLGCLRKTLLGREISNAVDHRIWIFLDELPTFCDADGLTVERLVSLGRSRGLRCVAALQDPAQLRARLGADQTTALLANFGLKIITRVVPGPGAVEISGWFGTRTVTWDPVRHGGRSDVERPLSSIPTVSTSDVTGLLGKFYTATGSAFIRAAILGLPDVPILEWPIRSWTGRTK